LILIIKHRQSDLIGVLLDLKCGDYPEKYQIKLKETHNFIIKWFKIFEKRMKNQMKKYLNKWLKFKEKKCKKLFLFLELIQKKYRNTYNNSELRNLNQYNYKNIIGNKHLKKL
jgi:hypothetical protein